MVVILCAQVLVQFYTNQFEILQTLLTWSADVHVVLASSSVYFVFTFLTFEWGGGVGQRFCVFYITRASNSYWRTVGQGQIFLWQVRVKGNAFIIPRCKFCLW